MADFRIEPSTLKGDFWIPSSKSQTLRAILFAALSNGSSTISNALSSPDSESMIRAVSLFGASVSKKSNTLEIQGIADNLKTADDVIDCGNSGLVFRFLTALSGLSPQYTILTGDASIRYQRPIKPLLSAIEQLGAFAVSSRGDGHAPIVIRGPFLKGRAELDGQDSQPVSALLIAASLAPHPIELHVANPGEKPWIDLTLHWLKKLNIAFEQNGHSWYRLQGNSKIEPFQYSVPGDFSTAAFPIAAALATNSEITLHNLDFADAQGDKALLSILQAMNARFEIDPEKKTLYIPKNQTLRGIKIDVNDFIDALPILAVLGCFAEGETEIRNALIARQKESDRIAVITLELKKMGADIEEMADGLLIRKSTLRGAILNSHLDHRIAMSLSIAALGASGPSRICDISCIDKTYPSFRADFSEKGANISL
ncbi:MAG: 3-phosphoshikimate 1-carboxyvinyltransferase [Chlamydiae bacterium]|nr:3-phosphoshikimate 1-carboxyvinyltransferase [Chlamydiota bacterium]